MSTLAAGRSAPGTGARFAFARAIRLIAAVVAAIIVLGILLVILEAKPANDIVGAITDAARWLAGPFRGIFSFDSHKAEVAVNWGLAAVIYYAIAHLIARFAART